MVSAIHGRNQRILAMQTPIDSALDYISGLVAELESGPFASGAVWAHEMAMANASLEALSNLKQAMSIAANEAEVLAWNTIPQSEPSEQDWEAASELASERFDGIHEFPNMAHPRDREEWMESEVEAILKEKGFAL